MQTTYQQFKVTEFLIRIDTGSTDPTASEITEILDTTAGVQGKFVITTKDTEGNYRVSGGDLIGVTISNADHTVPTNQISIVDLANGQYRVNFVVYKSGDFDL